MSFAHKHSISKHKLDNYLMYIYRIQTLIIFQLVISMNIDLSLGIKKLELRFFKLNGQAIRNLSFQVL